MYFEDLEIWKSARKLTNRIYKMTKKREFSKDYGLVDQVRRASVSIMSNIAEGYERNGNQEFIQYLSIAKGSCGEVRCQLYIAADQGYMDRKETDELLDDCKKISIMIHRFMEHLKGSRFKGVKYKKPKRKTLKEELDEIIMEIDKKGSND